MADRLNKLNGKEWLQHSFSIWRDIQKNQEERALKHPAMFPIMLAERIIEIFLNKPGMTILDPFMGSGTTLIAAQKLGHTGIGFDITTDYVKMAKERLEVTYRELFNKNVDYKIYCDTAYKISKYCEQNSVDLCVTSPPYWDILNQKRTADRKQIRKYSDLHVDFGNIENYEPHAAPLKERINSLKKLQQKGFKTWTSIEPYPTPNILRQDLKDILEVVSFVNRIVFGKLNYNVKSSQFEWADEFYNSQVRVVINFCKKNNIDCYIKHGTQNFKAHS